MLEGIIPQSKAKELVLRDGTQICYREWKGGKHKDVIVCLHGLESHAGWYVDTGNLLNREGLNVYWVDRRGSGMNHSDRGHMENYWILVGDVREVIERARGEHPDKRIYLLGPCWGAKIAVKLAVRHSDLIDGLILITPAIKTKADLPLMEKLDVIYSNFFRPQKLFDIPLKDYTFTRNPKYVEFIKDDRLKLRKVTARFFFQTGKMNLTFDMIAHKIRVPTLVLLSGNDTVVDNEGIKKWFRKISSKDKTIKTFDGSCHSLHFEDSKNMAACIAGWIAGRNH